MCMNLITLQTYYPPICENGLKMANGFKHWKGESRREVENKGKNPAHACTETLMWLHKSFLEIPAVEGVDREREGETSRGLEGKSNGKGRWSGRCAVELQRHFRVDHTKEENHRKVLKEERINYKRNCVKKGSAKGKCMLEKVLEMTER